MIRIPLALALAAACAAAQIPPQLGGCSMFPGDNAWNVPVDHLAVHPNSATYISTIGAGTVLHPDFGALPYGIPYGVVPGTQPKVPVTFDYADESDPGPYPIPPNPPIEAGSDGHILLVDRDNCVLYELYAAEQTATGWRAGSGAIFDLKSNALRPAGWTSADAAGLPMLPGLVRYDEVASGEIRHAIRLTVPETQHAYVWPARHFASQLRESRYPPMGLRFRLRADFDLSGFSPAGQVILRALQKYGMILADNGAAWYITGAPDNRWDMDTLLGEFRRVKGSDFEAVDTSIWMGSADSAAVRPAAWNPSVANAASLCPGPIAAGELLTIPDPVGFAESYVGPGDTELAGRKVLFDGRPAPLLFAGQGRLIVVAPSSIAGQTSTEIMVPTKAFAALMTLDVRPAAPGLFPGAILNQDGTLNTPNNRAARGSVVTIFGTGGVAGAPPQVRIGGSASQEVWYSTVDVPGLFRITARVPSGAGPGPAVPVLVVFGGFPSQPEITIAVK